MRWVSSCPAGIAIDHKEIPAKAGQIDCSREACWAAADNKTVKSRINCHDRFQFEREWMIALLNIFESFVESWVPQ